MRTVSSGTGSIGSLGRDMDHLGKMEEIQGTRNSTGYGHYLIWQQHSKRVKSTQCYVQER